MKRKKVLFLIHTLGGGGAEKTLVTIANELDKCTFDVTVMTVIDTGIYRNQLNSDVHYRTIMKIPSLFKKKQPDVSGSLMASDSFIRRIASRTYLAACGHNNFAWIYNHFIKPFKYDVEIAYLEGICSKILAHEPSEETRKIAWIHTEVDKNTKSSRFFRSKAEEIAVYQFYKEIVCVSDTVRDAIIKEYDLDQETRKIITLRNPISISDIVDRRNEFVSSAVRRRFTICSIGHLDYVKGYDRLIRACAKVRDDGFLFDCWIIGDGPEFGALTQLIFEQKLNDCVSLLGYKKNPLPYLDQADVFVCSSRAEGYSTVIIEACVLGVPVLSTSCSGVDEQLGDSRYGLVVDNSEEGLYRGLRALLSDSSSLSYYRKAVLDKANLLINHPTGLGDVEDLLNH